MLATLKLCIVASASQRHTEFAFQKDQFGFAVGEFSELENAMKVTIVVLALGKLVNSSTRNAKIIPPL